jgi:peptide chain release factor subunit 1
MLTEEDITALEHDATLRPPVVSFYVNTDRGTPEGERYLGALRHLLQIADRTLRLRAPENGEQERALLHTVITPKLLAFLEEHVESLPTARSVALFTSVGGSQRDVPLRAFSLPRQLRSQVHVDERPYVRPLQFLLDQYERVAVLVADRNHARLFTLYLGEIEESAEWKGDAPPRHDQGGSSQKRFQAHVDDHIFHHIRAAVTDATARIRRLSTRRMILGGDDEARGLLRSELPDDLRALLVGEFSAAPHASLHELRERAMEIATRAESEDEAATIVHFRNALARHRRAVSGLSATLEAITERRALALLVKKGFHAAGAICPNCHALLPTRGLCPHCRAHLTPVEDVVAHALEHAAADNAQIEFVAESADLEALGNIGAILRY